MQKGSTNLRAAALLDPTDAGLHGKVAAPRIASLANVRIGLLDNRKPNAALLPQNLGELLVREHSVTERRSAQRSSTRCRRHRGSSMNWRRRRAGLRRGCAD
ncbi:MAG: UGSC family (seleno)protein [Dehalococcoidia bacterium]